jgi:hypothetical protein
MSAFRKTNGKTVKDHLRAFAKWLDEEANDSIRAQAAGEFNSWMNRWLADDAFGTEGQCDPRGDHRD